ASRQTFTVPDGDFNHDHLFYENIQAGKNRDNAAISCSFGVVYSRKALKAIGGFSEWNLVEDLHTSYIANSKGYRSVYVTQPYTLGHAPTDLSQVYKQRGTWALDTLRIFFWQNPLLQKGLTWRQKLHYFEMCYAYLVSAYFITGIYLINFYSLFTDEVILSGGWWYVVFRLPAMIASLWLFGRMSRGQLTWRIWAGLFPVYAIAGVKALFYRKKKPQYIVTSKVDHGKPEVRLVIPQLLMSFIGVFGLIYHIIVFGINLMFIFNFFWIGVMLYWLWPVISIGLKFKDIRVWTRKYSLQKTKRLSATS
ncbi:glycosyltransferase, partial [Candidatus Saccharibacteria bacterium]|nr:glycosyltransferase [Candidatus Saccharibacteria bacterium]